MQTFGQLLSAPRPRQLPVRVLGTEPVHKWVGLQSNGFIKESEDNVGSLHALCVQTALPFLPAASSSRRKENKQSEEREKFEAQPLWIIAFLLEDAQRIFFFL